MTNAKKSHDKKANQDISSTTILDKLKKASEEIVKLSPSPRDENEVVGMYYVDSIMYGMFAMINKTKESYDKYDELYNEYDSKSQEQHKKASGFEDKTGMIDNDIDDKASHYEGIRYDVQRRLERLEMIKSFLDEIVAVPAINRIYTKGDFDISAKRKLAYRKKGVTKVYTPVKL